MYDVTIDKRSGRAEYAIMIFGGFLGIGDRYHPLPWQSLAYNERQGSCVIKIGRSRLERGPPYKSTDLDRCNDPRYGREVNGYYGY